MASLRSRFFIGLFSVMNMIKYKMRNQKPDYSHKGILLLREKTEKSGKAFGKAPKGVRFMSVQINQIYAEMIVPENCEKDKIILYFHGGGYVIGSVAGHRVHVSKVVAKAGVKALLFDYRLAPEHQFPKALNDAVEAYFYLIHNNYQPENIVLMGDSAGGGLLLCLLNYLKQHQQPLPAGAVALSPWTDLACKSESLESNAKVDNLSWKDSWLYFSEYYCGNQSKENPLISPVYGDLEGLPPMQIYAGNDETLRDDSIRYAQKAKTQGVEVELIVKEKMFHCYPICAPLFPEATEAMNQIITFIKKL